MSFTAGGEDPCPYHKRVLVKWEIRGVYPLTASKKHVTVGKPRGRGKIDCPALSEDGSRCLIDWGHCPSKQILESLIIHSSNKRGSRKTGSILRKPPHER